MFVRKLLKQSKGQGLVETLLAVAVVVIIVTALISLAVYSVRSSKEANNLAQASQLAAGQLEYARVLRDNPTITWAGFTSSMLTCAAAEGCHLISDVDPAKPPRLIYSRDSSIPPFIYYFTVSCPIERCSDSPSVIRVHVTVTWSVGGKSQQIFNDTDFTNWRKK